MILTQVPISMIDTVAGDAGKVLASNGSTLSWIASSGNTSAKAWVNFNGTTSPGTIRSSYNVSSVTKNGTGDYTINFTNAMNDANYSMSQSATTPSDGNYPAIVKEVAATPRTTSLIRVYVQGQTSIFPIVDSSTVCVQIFGN